MCTVSSRPKLRQRVMLAIKQFPHRRQHGDLCEYVLQILTITVRWMALKVEGVLVPSDLKPITGTRQPSRLNQTVVFEKPNENAAQNPCHRDLSNVIIPPHLIHLCRPTGRLCSFVLFQQMGVDGFLFLNPPPNVVLQALQQSLQVRQKSRWINHCGCFAFLDWSMLPPPR